MLHQQAAGIFQTIDPFLSSKIEELVKEGVGNVNEMRRYLKVAVKRDLFEGENLPPITNKRYFPRPKTIRNHIVKATRKLRRSLIDQECLVGKIQQWQLEDPFAKIYFRPKGKPNAARERNDLNPDDLREDDIVKLQESAHSLLFVYQTHWQQHLLARYGNELVFLDATYRTSKYALPLFFLVVKTNVDYQIVATFVCESECTETIEEALSILKEWNPNFSPTLFMTDYSNEEIAAIESLFKGILSWFFFACCFQK